jgi:hypothetical protein
LVVHSLKQNYEADEADITEFKRLAASRVNDAFVEDDDGQESI